MDEEITAHSLLQQAIEQNASDIHIEPYEAYCRIRFRKDGLLREITTISHSLAQRLTTCFKIMAQLDIAEKRLPQDGHFQFELCKNNVIDTRINTCPILFGEKIVLRIFNTLTLMDIEALGMTSSQQKIFIQKISAPQGLILMTGATGSGKTMTLYAALKRLNSSDKNIITAEDPVERQLTGINQVNINPKIGLSFSAILRSLLRQDPDIIMIGEIRDAETAQIAIQASETGHLVLSTLHTNNVIETLTRLQSMAIDTYHLAHGLTLIIAQRLVRKLCLYCRIQQGLLYYPVGCNYCYQGFNGRIGIYEFLPITENISELILSRASFRSIKTNLKQQGFLSLRERALQTVNQGLTSLCEINRVIT